MKKGPKIRPIIVGICGRSCSGKSTIARAIRSIKPRDIVHIDADHFARAVTPHRFNGFENVDHPSSIKVAKLIRAIKLLKQGKSALIPKKRGERKHGRVVAPKKIILVDGFLIYSNKGLVGLFDKKIFIDVSDNVIKIRRLARNRHPKYDHVDYIDRVVIPFSKKYDALQKANADFIVNGEMDHKFIVRAIREHLAL